MRSGAFTNNEAFLGKLIAAADAEGEKMWHMPLDDDYKESLKSAFADLQNIGPRWGGAVTAAMFLRDFVGDTPWVHLDIAGTAWLDDAKPYMAKGPTGVGVRTFVKLAMSWWSYVTMDSAALPTSRPWRSASRWLLWSCRSGRRDMWRI